MSEDDEAPSRAAKVEVVDLLRSAITHGERQPNERLVELELAAHYGVGRAAVRAALLELTKEGLVERPQNRGARVRSITRDEAIEIAEARMANEGLCAAKAAERATSTDVAHLRDLLARMRSAVDEADLMRYSDLNRELHQSIRAISRHETASRIVRQLRNQLVRHQFRLAFVPGRAQNSLAEHAEIVEAIAVGDPERASKAMQGHLEGVIDVLSAQPSEAWL